MKTPSDSSLMGNRNGSNGSISYNGHNGNGKSRHHDHEKSEFEFLPFAEILLRRWSLLILGAVAMAIIGVLVGGILWRPNFTASAELIAYDSPNATEVFGNRQVSPQTIASVLRSPELFRKVGAQATPQLTAGKIAERLDIMPSRDSDTIVVTAEASSPEGAVNLVNLYASEAVKFTQQLQGRSASELDSFYSRQLGRVTSEISTLDKQAQSLPREILTQVTAPQPNALLAQLQTARISLAQLLSKYTDMHPLVQAQRAEIAAIEMQLAPGITETPITSTNALSADPTASSGENDPEIIRGKLQAFENARLTLLSKQQAVQSFEANPPGFCRPLSSATEKDVMAHSRMARILLFALFAGIIGIFGTGGLVLLAEVSDNRLKTPADVARVTKLPVLAASGDLSRMTESARYNWAFRTWTKLQGQLGVQPDHGMIVGVTSANHGDGCSMWVQSLAQTATALGFRVLTIVTRDEEAPDGATAAHAKYHFNNGTSLALTPSILTTPETVAEQLQAMPLNSQAIVHIPLPGWVWNLERRRQWQAALRHWAQIDNVVILIELPPAAVPESVLLAENLPNVVWLTDCHEPTAVQTREHLETFRNAHCNLAGAVLHRAPASVLKTRFARWVSCVALLIGLSSSTGWSQDATTPAATPAIDEQNPQATAGSLTVRTPVQRAAWQEHFTLGAGDVVNISLYGSPELTQFAVPIGPDGRIGYLEAQDVVAAGLTVDELRTKMDEQLGQYRRGPRTIITPVSFSSKKYYVLGSVSGGGAFTLDRPMSIVEAIARAKGLQTTLQARNVVEAADLRRAFLARHGQRMQVDLERLFTRGDLSQNVQLEPEDYLYIPATELRQVYVVGEINSPGAAAYSPNLSVLAAIAEQGGFSTRAWKKNILVVRGSLSQPQTYVVNASDVIAGKTPDFRLEPGDIVYVHYRPWIYAEELLNIATSSFVQSVVITWTGLHAGPIITAPLF